jgi:glycosyltransferase involved in cell wall biosynthesis
LTHDCRRFVIITPCRDEAAHLETTIASVVNQTVRPTVWIIVDDGSQDDTPRILASAQRHHSFIRLVRRPDRGRRAVGSGVIDAFYAGLATIRLEDFDYVCKLDADLRLSPHYFQRVLERFESDPLLGTFSGKTYVNHGGQMISERMGDEQSVGPVKFYRVKCFQDIGGFAHEVCWDGIDGHRCRQLGWIACSEDDPDLRITHLRRMGSSDRGLWTGRLRWGEGKYYMGSRFYYVLAASLFRMFEPPYFVGGLGILVGYLRAALARKPRVDDEDYLRFFRRYELESLLLGKRRTMERYHRRIRGVRRESPASTVTP